MEWTRRLTSFSDTGLAEAHLCHGLGGLLHDDLGLQVAYVVAVVHHPVGTGQVDVEDGVVVLILAHLTLRNLMLILLEEKPSICSQAMALVRVVLSQLLPPSRP